LQIERRHDVVSAFVDDASVRQDLRTQLKRIPDIERLARKLETKRASLSDIVKLYQVRMSTRAALIL
jgi:DNA mismatch repair protein MSH2